MNIDAKAISMDEAEYQKNMELAQTLLSGLSGVSENLPSQSNQSVGTVPQSQLVDSKHDLATNKHRRSTSVPQSSSEQSLNKSRIEEPHVKDQISKILSISDLENKGASILLKEDKAGKAFQNFPYLYSRFADLTIADVEDLLNNYKELVFKYVCLAKGLGAATPPPQTSMNRGQNDSQSEKVDGSEDIRETKSENVHGPADVREMKSNDEMHKDIPSMNDDSKEIIASVDNNPESKLSEDEPVSTQTEEEGEFSQR